MSVSLTPNNCTECLRYVKPKGKKIMLTVVIMKTEETIMFLCQKCLDKFKEKTKDQKVAVEIDPNSLEPSILYCYRCGLKTKDDDQFLKHDCKKTKATLDFVKSLMENNNG